MRVEGGGEPAPAAWPRRLLLSVSRGSPSLVCPGGTWFGVEGSVSSIWVLRCFGDLF